MDILDILFPTIEHFTPDWVQNFPLFGIHCTHFPETFHDDKALKRNKSVNRK